MENVASNDIQSVIEHCPVFAGKNKEAFCIYEIKFLYLPFALQEARF